MTKKEIVVRFIAKVLFRKRIDFLYLFGGFGKPASRKIKDFH